MPVVGIVAEPAFVASAVLSAERWHQRLNVVKCTLERSLLKSHGINQHGFQCAQVLHVFKEPQGTDCP